MNVLKLKMTAAALLLFSGFCLANTPEDDAYLAAVQQFNLRDWDHAQQSFHDFQTHFPNSRWRWAVRLRLADLESDPGRAEKLYREVMAQREAPEWAWDARWGLASAEYGRGRYAPAREIFLGLAQSRDIRRLRAQYYLGLCELALNRPEAARDDFAGIVEHQPQAEVAGAALLAWGDAEAAARRPDAARRHYQDYLQAKPEGVLAAQAREKLRALDGGGNTPAAAAEKIPPPAAVPVKVSAPAVVSDKIPAPVPTSKPLPPKAAPAPAPAVSAPAAMTPDVPAAPGKRAFCVQVGAFSKMEYAQGLVKKLQTLGLAAFIQDTKTMKDPLHMVRVGPYASRAEAERQAVQLRQNEGMPTLVVPVAAPSPPAAPLRKKP
jgi:cell division septation protein DedD